MTLKSRADGISSLVGSARVRHMSLVAAAPSQGSHASASGTAHDRAPVSSESTMPGPSVDPAPSEAVLVVMTTAPDGAVAEAIARTLVEERLAACVSRTPVGSTYRWEGNVVSEPEVLLVIKTTAQRWPDLERRIREIHTYQTPEIVALGAEEVEKHYLSWLIDAVADGDESN